MLSQFVWCRGGHCFQLDLHTSNTLVYQVCCTLSINPSTVYDSSISLRIHGLWRSIKFPTAKWALYNIGILIIMGCRKTTDMYLRRS
jgi:hypothetical protein